MNKDSVVFDLIDKEYARQKRGIACCITDKNWMKALCACGLEHGGPNAGRPQFYQDLIDGMNGLCISIFIASSLALFLLGRSYPGIYMGAMALGVLCWNFPSAQTFLGDGGSTLLGYLFASHFLTSSANTLKASGITDILILFVLFGGIPVVDTLTAFTRRMLTGKSPFYPDKKHLHHILISLTGSNVLTVTIILSLQVIMLALGLRYYMRLI